MALKQQKEAVGGEEREERKIGQTRLDVKNLVLSQGGAERYIIHLGHGRKHSVCVCVGVGWWGAGLLNYTGKLREVVEPFVGVVAAL